MRCLGSRLRGNDKAGRDQRLPDRARQAAIARLRPGQISSRTDQFPDRSVPERSVLGAEQPVAGIAEPRHDVGVVVEVIVQGADVHGHVGVVFLVDLYAFR